LLVVSFSCGQSVNSNSQKKINYILLSSCKPHLIDEFYLSVQEELGLEYDEDVDVTIQPYSEMLASLNKRRKVSR
jgi:hypothetical protein